MGDRRQGVTATNEPSNTMIPGAVTSHASWRIGVVAALEPKYDF